MNKAINLSGKMTILGVTKLSEGVIKSMLKASQEFYLISDLRKETEAKIAEKFKADDCFITSSASAGIVSSILAIKKQLFDKGENRKVKVVLPMGHDINYGAPIKKIIELGGAKIKFIGKKYALSKNDLQKALAYKPDLAFFVSSHYASIENHVTFDAYNKFFQKQKILTAIDIAAEENAWKFIESKFTFTILSGSKALSGPASGLIFIPKSIKEDLNYTLQNEGRAMKISKENILGLLQAVKEYKKTRIITEVEKNIQTYINIINKQTIFEASISTDKARKINRILIASKKPKIKKLLTKLHDKNVYAREYKKEDGQIEFDLRQTTDKELRQVINIMKEGVND